MKGEVRIQEKISFRAKAKLKTNNK
jgi:hypothetical protein